MLESDEVDRKSILPKGRLDVGKREVIDDGAGVSLEAGAEAVQILLLGRIDEPSPGFLSLELRDTSPVDSATLLTLKSLVAFLIAKLALRGVGWAVACSMSVDTAGVAGTGELALDARIGAVGLVVSNLATVEALPSEAAARWCVGAFASEVAFCTAAAKNVSMVSGRSVANRGSIKIQTMLGSAATTSHIWDIEGESKNLHSAGTAATTIARSSASTSVTAAPRVTAWR